MVADNYCFVVDGDNINISDIMSSNKWWRHTSRSIKYYYSEDLKKLKFFFLNSLLFFNRFYRVNCLRLKDGRVTSARFANTTPAMGRISPTTSLCNETSAYQNNYQVFLNNSKSLSSSFISPIKQKIASLPLTKNAVSNLSLTSISDSNFC